MGLMGFHEAYLPVRCKYNLVLDQDYLKSPHLFRQDAVMIAYQFPLLYLT